MTTAQHTEEGDVISTPSPGTGYYDTANAASTQDDGKVSNSATDPYSLSSIMSNVRDLDGAPRELWLVYALKFFSSYSYFALSLVLTLYMSEAFGMSDIEAGVVFGMSATMASIFGIACGWLIDMLGVRRSLIAGALLGAISRLMVALTASRTVAVAILVSTLPLSDSLGIPVLTIGVKRYTTKENRSFAYSLFYSVMNIGAVVSGPAVDACRSAFPNGIAMPFPLSLLASQASALRVVVLSTALSSVFLLFVSLFVREIEVDDTGANDNTAYACSPTPLPARRDAVARVLRDTSFWRLFVFTLLLVGVKLIFAHMSATLPKYLIRQFGPDTPFGLVFAIDPFLIIFLVPAVALVTKHVSSFDLVLRGSFVAAASPLCAVVTQSYAGIIAFQIVLSLGEAVYSPSTYEYAMAAAPRGKEGLYTSLASAPLFCAPLISGAVSGWLLQTYMPPQGPLHGRIVWGVIAAMSLTSPFLMLAFRRFLADNKPTPSVPDEEQTLVPHDD